MNKKMTICYPVKNGLYVNITNRCPCACVFCLRKNADGVYGSDSLWLEHEPSLEEIKAEIDRSNPEKYEELVFCGYGEPTERLDTLLGVASYVKSCYNIPIRINTNGLSDLINGEPTAQKLGGLIDTVSISLNATDEKSYNEIVRPKFGIKSYEAMLKFAKDCSLVVPRVVMTVVDVVTSKEEQEKSRKIAESHGATLRIRPYEE